MTDANMICLDSTALIEILRGGETGEKILADLGDEPLCTTEVNRYEILRAVHRHGRTKERRAFAALCEHLTILPLSAAASAEAARVYGYLGKAGGRIGDVDCLIAGIMLAHDVSTIMTKNAAHFERIGGMEVLGHD